MVGEGPAMRQKFVELAQPVVTLLPFRIEARVTAAADSNIKRISSSA
jgi:hypothetical protein